MKIFTKRQRQNSFIPFDVKLEFDLPTYREKDAIFSYHFFRLLQRAKNIFFYTIQKMIVLEVEKKAGLYHNYYT